MSSNTATVEVLTAEVRVLMVGSRQVTLSVFGQLDWVHPHLIRPFGRVRPRGAGEKELYVVGSDEAGSLVRSYLQRDDAQAAPGGSGWGYISWATAEYRVERRLNPEHGAWVDKKFTAWLSLPLIVLAGLR